MHTKYNCHATKQILPVSYTQYTYVVPISTSGMLAHILTDCSRRTGEGQGEEEEEEEDTEEGQELETASGRPSRANWHL